MKDNAFKTFKTSMDEKWMTYTLYNLRVDYQYSSFDLKQISLNKFAS
jgi:hypothetical protein